jgi:hypothetical protein
MKADISTAAATAGSEFDAFLYEPIGEEHNGMLLSVLSALARRNLDPWDEAARLAQLPDEAARGFLTSLLAALPEGPRQRTDPAALADRLISLLPKRVSINDHRRNPAQAAQFAANRHAFNRSSVISIALMVFFLVAHWLMGHFSQHAAQAGPAPARIAAPVSAPAIASHPER